MGAFGTKNHRTHKRKALGASRAVDTLSYKFGGPATTGYYDNWMKELLDFISENNLRLDFISWHRYSKNLDDYLSDVAKARSLLADYYDLGTKETIISETGPNSENDPVYDNAFGAIHQIATSAVLQNEVTRTFTFEIKDGANSDKKLWGRWGLITHEKFGTPEIKPRGNAIAFLNNMIGGTKLNVFGQGSWVKSLSKKLNGGITKILVVNYDPEGMHDEVVPIMLVNLPSGNFSFKRIDFLGDSLLQDVATTSAEWSTNQYFKANSAAIFEIVSK
ncbi:MAG: glycosyl hydrolase [Candidatus Woesebacteria bacterium]|nr:glycosyl hydrolase [Candidatus Woesebacteria bacterium]